ncbi:MAG: transporter permease [Rubritepida sp.]|nr:transporter permease [Rubritepida sp.]
MSAAVQAAEAAPPTRRFLRLPSNPYAILVPAALILAWQLADLSRTDGFSMYPTLQGVVSCWLDWVFNTSGGQFFYSGTLWIDFIASMARVLGGLLLGSALAVALGLLALWVPLIDKLTDPIIQMLRPIPKTAFLPFAILLFGLGNGPALFITTYGVFLIVYVQVVMSIKLVPADLRNASRMLGASRRKVLTSVVLPAALPGICGGIRIGASYAWLILILAEMLAVQEGFGYVLWHAYEFMRMDVVVAAMLTIGVCGFLMDLAIVAIMRRHLSWAVDIAQANV